MFLQDPIPQSVKYHSFVDDRGMFGVVNFYNVISNFMGKNCTKRYPRKSPDP
jgi:hypothetical protein